METEWCEFEAHAFVGLDDRCRDFQPTCCHTWFCLSKQSRQLHLHCIRNFYATLKWFVTPLERLHPYVPHGETRLRMYSGQVLCKSTPRLRNLNMGAQDEYESWNYWGCKWMWIRTGSMVRTQRSKGRRNLWWSGKLTNPETMYFLCLWKIIEWKYWTMYRRSELQFRRQVNADSPFKMFFLKNIFAQAPFQS